MNFMFRIKICGITTVDDARTAANAGADAIGLNFYERSARHVSLESARQIAAVLPQGVVKVGLFVNASPTVVCELFDELRLDLIQLHGDEPPEYLPLLGGRPVMRAFRVKPGELATTLAYLDRCREQGVGPRLVLIDSAVVGEYGGTGQTADWSAARDYAAMAVGDEGDNSILVDTKIGTVASLPPLVLAGGLTAENVARAIAAVRPTAVDVASGVESEPGRKDPRAVEAFVRAAREAFGA
jgi:phosphoribosylanthranilate isomerase